MPANQEAGTSRQQQIEDDRRVRTFDSLPDAARPIAADVDLEALCAQPALEHAADRIVVLDHQHSHGDDGSEQRRARSEVDSVRFQSRS